MSRDVTIYFYLVYTRQISFVKVAKTFKVIKNFLISTYSRLT